MFAQGRYKMYTFRDGAALTPCPSPLAKSAPEEGSVLSYPGVN